MDHKTNNPKPQLTRQDFSRRGSANCIYIPFGIDDEVWVRNYCLFLKLINKELQNIYHGMDLSVWLDYADTPNRKYDEEVRPGYYHCITIFNGILQRQQELEDCVGQETIVSNIKCAINAAVAEISNQLQIENDILKARAAIRKSVLNGELSKAKDLHANLEILLTLSLL